MSSVRFQRLRRDLEHELQVQRPYTPIYALLGALERYQRGLFAEEALKGELQRCLDELEGMLDYLEENDPEQSACAVFAEALDILEEFFELEVSEFHRELLALEPRFLDLNLQFLGHQAERHQHYARLQKILDEPVPEEELIAGYYQEIEATVGEWFDEELPDREAIEVLETHLHRVEKGKRGYEESYLPEGDWTIDVAVCDELLQSAYQSWLQGLADLLEAIQESDPEQAEVGLGSLLNGNYAFVQVRRLAS